MAAFLVVSIAPLAIVGCAPLRAENAGESKVLAADPDIVPSAFNAQLQTVLDGKGLSFISRNEWLATCQDVGDQMARNDPAPDRQGLFMRFALHHTEEVYDGSCLEQTCQLARGQLGVEAGSAADGFDDIAYHYGLCFGDNGTPTVVELRPFNKEGAHTMYHNRQTQTQLVRKFAGTAAAPFVQAIADRDSAAGSNLGLVFLGDYSSQTPAGILGGGPDDEPVDLAAFATSELFALAALHHGVANEKLPDVIRGHKEHNYNGLLDAEKANIHARIEDIADHGSDEAFEGRTNGPVVFADAHHPIDDAGTACPGMLTKTFLPKLREMAATRLAELKTTARDSEEGGSPSCVEETPKRFSDLGADSLEQQGLPSEVSDMVMSLQDHVHLAGRQSSGGLNLFMPNSTLRKAEAAYILHSYVRTASAEAPKGTCRNTAWTLNEYHARVCDTDAPGTDAPDTQAGTVRMTDWPGGKYASQLGAICNGDAGSEVTHAELIAAASATIGREVDAEKLESCQLEADSGTTPAKRWQIACLLSEN